MRGYATCARGRSQDNEALDELWIDDTHMVGLEAPNGNADVNCQLIDAEYLAEGILYVNVVLNGYLREISATQGVVGVGRRGGLTPEGILTTMTRLILSTARLPWLLL